MNRWSVAPGDQLYHEYLLSGYCLIQVNGKDVRGATHQEAVMALIAPTFEIVLDIRHDPPPPGLRVRT